MSHWRFKCGLCNAYFTECKCDGTHKFVSDLYLYVEVLELGNLSHLNKIQPQFLIFLSNYQYFSIYSYFTI